MIFKDFIVLFHLRLKANFFVCLEEIQFISQNNMACLKQKSLLDLPNEIIEEMMTFLSFRDLYELRKLGKRLADCTERVLKNKPFSKYIQKIIMLIIIWLLHYLLRSNHS